VETHLRVFEGKGLLRAGAGILISWDGQSYVITSTAKGGPAGASGFRWMYPTHKELDPRLPYDIYSCAAISPLSSLVQNGLYDRVTGVKVYSTPGIWMAMQSVPKQITVGTLTKYNVPQLPLPGSNTSAPSGTPLKGDFDAASVFWVRISPYTAC
jgi:hypothetical protein